MTGGFVPYKAVTESRASGIAAGADLALCAPSRSTRAASALAAVGFLLLVAAKAPSWVIVIGVTAGVALLSARR